MAGFAPGPRARNGRALHWVELGPDGEPIDARMGETGPNDRRVNADALYPASDSLYLAWIAERFPELGLDPRAYEEALRREVAQVFADFSLPDGRLDAVRFSWQDQPVVPPVTLSDGSVLARSHVAIGGHTVMAAQALAQGALELYRLGAIDGGARDRYLDRAVKIVQDAVDHRVIEWDEGRVQNANLLEVPVEHLEVRRRPGGNDWGQAAWQQRELLQTLLVLREANRLGHLVGPGNARGQELLLNVLERVQGERVPPDYQGGFGDEWRYHGPRAVGFLARAMAQK